ncbi:hypothetical protein P0D72_29120 [Paraburkholderia sediminicola]|uniref:hypothetical protein n=1 Tax=Paraburkholderia sediminicola TaxID=458836 RepID=UPI0038BBD2DD
MTYSCSDFVSDVQRCLVESGALAAEAVTVGDIGEQADACISAVVSLGRHAAAGRFSRELLDSVESLGALAELLGNEALVTLFYLQAAILNGTYVELDQRNADIAALLLTLPSAADWTKHIQMIDV